MKGLDDERLFFNDVVENGCSPSGENGCTRFKEYLTKEEEAILLEIRTLREEALDIKNRLKSLKDSTAGDVSQCQTGIQSTYHERQTLLDKLEDLRAKRNELERLKEEARHRKMVMLGHEDP